MSGYPAVRSGRLIARMASSCMRRPPSGVSCPAGFSVCSVVWSAHSSPCSACFVCSDCSVCPDRSFSSISSIITESFLSSELAILNLPAALVRHMHLCGTCTCAAPALMRHPHRTHSHHRASYTGATAAYICILNQNPFASSGGL